MTETGVKLPGPTRYPNEEISLRLEHLLPTNGAFPLTSYFYNAETGPGFGTLTPLGATLQPGRWYCIEGHIKLNDFEIATTPSAPTVAMRNGITEIRVDGVQTYKRTDVIHRLDPALTLTHFHVNVYHGGNTYPLNSPIHYGIAKIGVGSNWFGVPPDMPAYLPSTGLPAWRQGLTVGAIANTSSMNGQALLGNGNQAASALIDNWSGLAAGPTTWWSCAASGHDAGNGNGWENKTVKIDLWAHVPRWALVHPGSPFSAVQAEAYYTDGLPCSRHVYYTAHYFASLNRVLLFGAAGVYSIGFPAPAFQGGGEVDGYRVDLDNWDPAGSWADLPSDVQWLSNSIAKHPVTEDVYVGARENFAKWTRSTNTWSSLFFTPDNHTADSMEFHGSLIDATRDHWVHLHWQGLDLTTINLTTLAVTRTTITGPYVGGDIEQYSTIVHDLDNDRYVTLKGTTLYAIDPTTAVSSVIATGLPSATNGSNNRLAYFQRLGGMAYLPSYASDILFIPTR